MTRADTTEELEAIRRRHGSDHLHLRYDSREYRELYENAHADRATLLQAIDALKAENERLRKLLDDVTGAEPINQDEMGGCVFCGGTPIGKPYGYATANPDDHDPECVWIEARAVLDLERAQ